MVLAHQRHGLGLEHALSVELAAIEQHAHEAAVVTGSRGQPATADRALDSEPRLHRLLDDRAVHALAVALLRGDEAGGLLLRNVVGGVIHAERREDVLAEIIFELLPRELLDQAPDDVRAGPVPPLLARLEQERAIRISLVRARLEIAQRCAGERIAKPGRM